MSVCTSERAGHEWSDLPYLKHVHVRVFQMSRRRSLWELPINPLRLAVEGDRRVGFGTREEFLECFDVNMLEDGNNFALNVVKVTVYSLQNGTLQNKF